LNDAFLTADSCVAISGLASHPFGSWQPKDNKGWMWIRDALAEAMPNARAVLFGYDTALVESNSFQTIADLASTLMENLKASGSPRPLIFSAHSLGGIVLKEALVTLANDRDRERQILRQVVGAVLFGVPSRGMKTQALMTMVRRRPNERLVRDLAAKSEHFAFSRRSIL
jgi:alpha-beta hydrolase superfamily lysophospholipase